MYPELPVTKQSNKERPATTVEVTYVRETAAALLFKFADLNDKELWVPKSITEYDATLPNDATIQNWWLTRNGIKF